MKNPTSITIGQHIRSEVLPQGLSINDAARQLGISRTTLSRVLNGKSSLSNDVAARLETAFGAKADFLLEMQSASTAQAQRMLKTKNAVTSAYSPSIFEIYSTDIEKWSEQIAARTGLPVLLRRLINSTANEITSIDFPGNNDGERHGHDGIVTANASSAWVPNGASLWEFGVNKNPKSKADKDYIARKPTANKEHTFIFVTPKRWPGKSKWVAEKAKHGEWKEVRAYDASDLEQWLEASATAQSWMARQLGLPNQGIKTLNDFWSDWSNACNPPVSRELFDQPKASVTEESNVANEFEAWITQPPEKALVVAADSDEEAIAFISCLLQEHQQENDRALVVSNEDSALTLLKGTRPPIIVANHPTVERSIAPYHHKTHCLIVRPRNDISIDIDIPLQLLTNESFCRGLMAMGYSHTDAEKMSAETGRSPTILRRHPEIAKPGAIEPLPWCKKSEIARNLIGPTLLGMWNTRREADKCIVSRLSTTSTDQYQLIESALKEIENLGESPIWRAADHIGMVSKIDTLFAISRYVTENDIDNFLKVARVVLSETDPALDLPEEDRWAANLYDKTRDHSPALRRSIGDTLVILSVDGKALFGERLSINIEAKVNALVEELLLPLTEESLLSQLGDLTLFAEAAPNVFLSAIESDVKSDNPVVHCLLKPVELGLHGGTNCAELLWAIELLAWQNLGRTNLLLGALSQIPIAENIGNKPINSLKSIFRYWIPQTAASEADRLKALEALFIKFPNEALQICFSIVGSGQSMIGRNSRPKRRNDAAGHGEPIEKYTKSILDYRFKALEMILDFKEHSVSSITQLIDTVAEENIHKSVYKRYWKTIENWSKQGVPDSDKAIVRNKIRNIYGCLDPNDSLPEAGEHIKRTFDLLRPSDSVARYAWLFHDTWVHWTQYELHSTDRENHNERELALRQRRCEAIKEIWTDGGLDSVLRLAKNCHGLAQIGRALRDSSVVTDDLSTVSQLLKSDQLPVSNIWWLIEGLISYLDGNEKNQLLTRLFKEIDEDRSLKILLAMQFESSTWILVSKQPKHLEYSYWREVPARSFFLTSESTSTAVKQLLAAGRPRAAFDAVIHYWDRLDTDELTTLLEANAIGSEGESTAFSDFETAEAFTSLSKRVDVQKSRLTKLEFAFLPVLTGTSYGTPNVQNAIQQDPTLFVQLLAGLYRRKDGGADPEEWRINDPDRRRHFASSSYNLLHNLSIVPRDKSGSINSSKLYRWIRDVRLACVNHDRAEIGDTEIGKLLAKEINKDCEGLPEPVAQVIEDCASESMASGFWAGAHNLRGVYMKSEKGGYQEHELAKKYRGYAENVEYLFPFAARALEAVADSYEREAIREDDELNIRSYP